MEKREKGLFGRLLAFWREKISMSEGGSIGFWHDTETVENHFAEMGAVVALSQQETKKVFWEEESAKAIVSAGEILEKQKKILPEKTAEEETEEEKMPKKEWRTNFFSAEPLGERGQAEEKEPMMRRAFFTETAEEEREKRRIVPVSAEALQEEKVSVEEEERETVREAHKKEETQTEPVIDIEGLMRQMTKKLWEERESCGRRLR